MKQSECAPALESDTAREGFLDGQVHAMVFQAMVQRAAIYAPTAPEGERIAFRQALRRVLDALRSSYLVPVPDDLHIERIVAIADQMSGEHGNALRGGRLRLGPAQKALNLYLKYQWCLGRLPPPPHCPFDARIIGTLPGAEYLAWTQLDDVAGYRRLIAAARLRAGGRSLAEWELDLYDRLLSSAGATTPVTAKAAATRDTGAL